MKNFERCWFVGVLLLSVSCQGEEDIGLGVDSGELVERMSVRVVGESGGISTELILPPDVFRANVVDACTAEVESGPLKEAGVDCSRTNLPACQRSLCDAEREMCVAHQLMNYARSVAPTEIALASQNFDRSFVPPQSPATNAGFAERAILAAETASFVAANALAGHRGTCDLPATIPVGDEGMQTGSAYAATLLVEAYHLATDEGPRALREFTTAVADQQFSDEAQIRDATSLAHTAPLLSRAWLAHILGGGTEGLPALPVIEDEGFCAEPRMSPEADRAVEILRIAAPPPDVILDESLDVDELFTGWGADPLDASLRGRLSLLLTAPDLEEAPASAIYERFGLSETAFIEARAHLGRELRAFGRSTAVQLPPDPIGRGRTSAAIDLYAATRNPPSSPHPAYYAAVARLDLARLGPATTTRPGPLLQTIQPLPDGTSRFRSVAHFVDAVLINTTGQLLRTFPSGTPAPLDAETRGILSTFVADAMEQREGRVQFCRTSGATLGNTVRVRVWGSWRERGLTPPAHELMLGHAGLQCAVHGNVDGAPCDLADYRVASTSALSNAGTLEGFPDRIEMTVANPSEIVADPLQRQDAALVFVVRPRVGSAFSAGDPGAYESVTGGFVRIPQPGETAGWRCDSIPVIHDIEEDVSEAIAPSTSYCAISSETCAGIPYDAPIPLENELISDFDPVESSWRHFLQRAQEAASHADQLGEDLIRSGIELDVRSEQAIDELENLCGVSLNIDDLTMPAGADAVGNVCNATTPCPAGYRCADGGCVVDPIAVALANAATDDDRRRLTECLGDSTIVPWTTLGHSPLCLWWIPGDPSTICAGEDDLRPCPFNGEVVTRVPGAPAVSTCNANQVPAGYTAIPVPETLGFFVAHEEPPPRDDGRRPADVPCGFLAFLHYLDVDSYRNRVFAAFDPSNLRPIARQLTFRPAAGDFGSVLLNDAPWLSTGTSTRGPGTRWPCGPREWHDQCPTEVGTTDDPAASETPFFCLDLSEWCDPDQHDPLDSATRIRRARANDLMARAVLAARMITGVSLEGTLFPFYARSQDEVVTIPEDQGDWLSEPRFDGEDLVQTGSSVLQIANPNDVFGSFDEYPLFDMNRGRAWRASGSATPYTGHCASIPRGAEWSHCPWDYALIDAPPCVEVFDDVPDCDDPRDPSAGDRDHYDRDVELIVRAFGPLSDGDAMTDASNDLWRRLDERPPAGSGSFFGLLERALTRGDDQRILIGPGVPDDVADLTNYWRRKPLALDTVVDAGCWSADTTLIGNGPECAEMECNSRYASCRADRRWEGFQFEETINGNRAFVAPRGLTQRDLVNGLELLCAAQRREIPGGIRCAEPPPITTVSDLFVAAEYLECMAASIETSASQFVIRDLPARAVDLMRQGGASGVYGNVSGEYGAAVSDLRAALIELADLGEGMAATTRAMAAVVRALRAEIARLDIQTEIADWQLASTISDQITGCAVAVANIWGGASEGAGGRATAAAATCVNSAVQIGIAARITDLSQEDSRLAAQQAFARFEQDFTTHARSLSGANSQIRASTERIDAARTRIDNIQSAGQRALARALFLDSDSTGRQYGANIALRRRHNTLRLRYEEAHRTAVRLAYLAKRALEQRLGMELDRMTEPLPLLDEPPSEWHMDVCSMSGINYDRIREARPGATGEREGDDSSLDVPENYAGEYVGDYVRKLELVFESYSLAFPFQDGTDTAVLSLRDELWRIRAPCSAEVPNLLLESGTLDAATATDGSRFGWSAEGCNTYSPWPPDGIDDGTPPPNCATAVPLDEPPESGPISPSAIDYGRVSGFRVKFGDATPRTHADGTIVFDEDGNAVTGTTVRTRLAQWLELSPGRYRVSWYARMPSGVPVGQAVPPQSAVRAFREIVASGATEPIPFLGTVYGPIDARSGWARYYAFFDVLQRSAVAIAVVPAYTTGHPYRVAEVAALMLEDVSARVVRDPRSAAMAPDGTATTVGATHPPAAFFATGQTRERVLEVCEDITGATFRERAWTRGCARLCPDGYGGNCSDLAAQEHCYFQTSFTLDPETLERTGLLGGGGLAFGNYNYRVESLGVNIVGTNVRDCENAEGTTPSTCYASGNIAYSVIHQGPYWVRNHTGGLYEAPLFTGRIERARAVAAERYLTNPLSSADRGLLEPYLRGEFRGRPMPGTYLLRVWDDPAVRFDRIEDVQLVVNYRYWTRQEP